MTISDSVKQVRKMSNLSQEAFAKELGVSFSTINRWENGKSKPHYDAIKSIARFCKANGMEFSFDETEF